MTTTPTKTPTTTHDQVPEIALQWVESGRSVALATVIETWGSAPRQPGALLAISSDGELAGSVSGGCVEGAVAAEALEAMEDGTCKLLKYGVSDDDAFAVGLACGGTIRIFVEPVGIGEGVPLETLKALCAGRADRRRMNLAVNLDTKSRHLIAVDYPDKTQILNDPTEIIPTSLTTKAEKNADSDTSGFDESGEWFLAVHNPPLKMAIIGAAHIAQPLSAMAKMTGFDVTVIDPRESFSSEARFPDMAISREWPDEALRALAPDARTAIVCLSHDPKIDDPALKVAFDSPAFYIGALGSTRTSAKRRERLMTDGHKTEDLDRIAAPVGLDIGSKSPAEIAVSIMAQIVERLRKPPTSPQVA